MGYLPLFMTAHETFSSAMAAKIARVTLPMLDNWHRRGILSPSVTTSATHPRRYTFCDLVAVRVIVALRDAGVDLGELRRVVEYLKKHEAISAVSPRTFLITDRHEVYEVDEHVALSALRKPAHAVLHLVPLGFLVREVLQDAQKLLEEEAA